MDLRTRYLGLPLKSPLVPSASPLSEKLDNIRRMEDAGAGAVVLFSLFEEQLTLTRPELLNLLSRGATPQEFISLMSDSARLQLDPMGYLEHLHRAKEAVDIPIIASVSAAPAMHSTHYVRLLEQAGADAVELNLYAIPTDASTTTHGVEQCYLDTVKAAKTELTIPLAIKLSPYFTHMANMARALSHAGADGLVLFNRFYQPDVDLESRSVRPHLLLSTPHDARLPLRWIALLRGQIDVSLAATGGIHTADDALKMVLVGADVTMVCSTLLRHGIERLRTMTTGMKSWMAAQELRSLDDFRGKLSPSHTAQANAFERAQYMRTLESHDPEAPTGTLDLGF